MYQPYFTDDFQNKLDKDHRRDRATHDRVTKTVDSIIENPEHNTFPLIADLLGKRKKRAGDIRIFFAICEECREKGYTQLNGCEGCETYPDDAIMFFDYSFRKDAYKKR